MPTSATWNYSVTALQVITAALEDCGIVASGATITPNDLSVSLRTLNLLVKQWQGSSDKFPGLKVWTRQRLTMFFASGQSHYLIGPATTDDRSTAEGIVTSLGAAKAAGVSTVTVASTTGMTSNDSIGFVTATGLGWAKIGSVDSATGLTLLTTPLAQQIAVAAIGAASLGSPVFTYTNKSQRFVEMEAAVLRDWSNPAQPIDIPIKIYTDVQQYEAITQKNAAGDPTAILVEPLRLNTVITTNFAAANVYKTLRLTVIYPSENYDDVAGANDIAYPQEYYAALEWELARRIAPKFGRQWSPSLQAHWQIAVNEGINLNPDDTHLSFEPGRDDMDVGSPFTRP